jgi:hypothetical protein
MENRRSRVAWDPRLIRVEYLDHEGEPYFCAFEKADDGLPGTRAGGETPADQPVSPVSRYAGVMMVLFVLLSVAGYVVWMAVYEAVVGLVAQARPARVQARDRAEFRG